MLDLLLRNGRVFHQGNFEEEDVGIKGNRIVKIGVIAEQASKEVDLEGRTVLPGFIDSHTHMLHLGLQKLRLDLSECKTREEVIEKVRNRANDPGTKVIVGYGWDESAWGETDYLRKDELDFIEKPVVMYRRDGHMATLNSAALRKLGLESRDGILKEGDLDLLGALVSPDPAEITAALEVAFNVALREGVTAVRDYVDRATALVYSSLNPPIRVYRSIYADEYFEGFQGESSWGVKAFLDGSIGARTAAHEGWPDSNLKMDDAQFAKLATSFWERGMPVAVHAIGDRAVSVALRVFQNAPLRNSVEHFELVNNEMLDEVGNTFISAQPNFLQWALPGGLYESRLGKGWLEQNNPFHEILARDLDLAFGSDCMPFGPSYGIYYAISSPYSKQRITLEQAIECYTKAGAKLLGAPLLGTISEGSYADIAVFGADYGKNVEALRSERSQMTIVNGRIAYVRSADGFSVNESG
ncbi:MAG: amidohydrolase [Thermoprotei archaeon]|nr:amidohydrolase [TACK group archaeon]